MTTTRHQSRHREEHEPQPEPQAAPAPAVDPHDISTLRNQHEDLPPPKPPVPLKGEVKDGASDPAEQDTVSVLANKPDHSPIPAPAPLEQGREIMDGAHSYGMVPPSLLGTSYEPQTV